MSVARATQNDPLQIGPLRRRDRRPAARLLADAFLDDPAWLCIGPRGRRHRGLVMRAWFPGALAIARRWGGPTWGARRRGELIAVAVCFDAGFSAPRSLRRALWEAGFLLAGPAPVSRGRVVQETVDAGHAPEAHLYLWLLAVAPASQRTGAGRALLERVAAHARPRSLPVCLEAINPANVPYYRSAGYTVTAEAPLPGGARVWFMRRPAERVHAPGCGDPARGDRPGLGP